MSKIQMMLEEAINVFGIEDEVTLLISKKRDEEILKEQREMYERFRGTSSKSLAR